MRAADDCRLCGGPLRLLYRGAHGSPTPAQLAPSCHATGAHTDLYRCERCHTVTHMTRGSLIQPCPHCGYDTFDISNPRFERRDGSLGPHEPG